MCCNLRYTEYEIVGCAEFFKSQKSYGVQFQEKGTMHSELVIVHMDFLRLQDSQK